MKKLQNPQIPAIFLLGIPALLYVVYNLMGPLGLSQSKNVIRQELKTMKTIFMWLPHLIPRNQSTPAKTVVFFNRPLTIDPNKPAQCPVVCQFTNNPDVLDTADAVAFDSFDLAFLSNSASLGGSRRSADQLYIFFTMEPPTKYDWTIRNRRGPNRFFNHTMSYRRDSTIYLPYYEVVKRRLMGRFRLPDMSKKTKFAAWMVTNCEVQSRRQILAHKLRSYVHVDIYGQCSKVRPPCEDDCYGTIGKSHKFYLSFESSLCEDYVTEKFFWVLQTDMIPIVYGQANYSLLAPPKSFIDVRDFPTVRDLATYLKRLDQNDTEYLEYFQWKKDWEVSQISGSEDPFCRICQEITSGNLKNKTSVIEDLSAWWITGKDGHAPACKEPPPQFL